VAVYAGMKGAAKLRIVQTNGAGDTVSIIDPATNKVVAEVKGVEATHGATVAMDGSRIYVTEEYQKALTVIDGKTLQVTKRVPLSGVPNLVQVTPDGRRLYVSITQTWDDLSSFPEIKANPSGGIDVIDAASLEKVKTIALKGGIHDMYISPDGKYVIAGGGQRRQAGGEPAECDRHGDQRGRVDALDEPIALAYGDVEKARRLDR